MKFPGPSVRPTSFLIIAEILRRSWKEASDVKGWNFSLQSAPKNLRSGNFQVFMRAFFSHSKCGSGFKARAFFPTVRMREQNLKLIHFFSRTTDAIYLRSKFKCLILNICMQ